MNLFANLTLALSTGDSTAAFLTVMFFIVYLCIYCFALFVTAAISTTMYVLQSIGLSAMLKKVGYAKPWHAWVPFANVYSLGTLADMYDDGKAPTSYGKSLLKLNIVIAILAAALFSFELPFYVVALMSNLPVIMILAMIVYIGMSVALFVIAIIQSVKIYFVYWRIFRIFHPEFSVLYLMLTLFVSSYAPGIIFFILRNREPQNLRAPEGENADSDSLSEQNPYHYE